MLNTSRLSFSKVLGVAMMSAVLFGCNNDQQASTTEAATPTQDSKNIAITAIVEHPALDAVREGVIEQLAEDGYKQGENLTVNFQSAQGNVATAGQIAKQFVSENPDAIVAIATPSAQAVASSTTTVPVVFSAVTDPVEAKLVKALEASGTNITGASDDMPLEPQIALIQELVPHAKKIGFVYNPGEINSEVTLRKLKAHVSPLGLVVVEAAAPKASDVAMATQSLVGNVDVIYTSTDNNVISSYEALAQVAKDAKIPLISSVTNTVERGATAALGVNYHDLGRETGKIVARIIKGEKAGEIPVFTAQNLDLHINVQNAKDQGVELPKSVLDKAAKVIDPTKGETK